MAVYTLLGYFTSSTVAKITWVSLITLYTIDADKIKISISDKIIKIKISGSYFEGLIL